MKVLQISKFYPPVMGGIEATAFELTEGLARRGIEVNVLCSRHVRGTVHDDLPAGYGVTRAGSFGRLWATSVAPAMFPAARRLCPAHDVVHIHMPDPMAAAALWAARPAAKVVVHWHSDVIRQRAAMALYAPLQRWVLRRADAIIATSEPYACASQPLQPWRGKVSVIPIGISDTLPPDTAAKAAKLVQRFGGRRIVFALGRMTYYKGFDVLIDAARLLPPDCVVLVGGKGDLLEMYRSRVLALGLGDKVFFEGHVGDEDLHAHFAAADVFCLPSTVRAEAYGVVMLEAMARGKPIVATNLVGSGVSWVNQHGVTGYNVAPNNPRALSKALCSLLDNPALAQGFGAAARSRYVTHLSADKMVDRTVALYESLLSQRVGATPDAGR
jgi:rhamnosyl/mannosyltransferase